MALKTNFCKLVKNIIPYTARKKKKGGGWGGGGKRSLQGDLVSAASATEFKGDRRVFLTTNQNEHLLGVFRRESGESQIYRESVP